MKVGIIGPAERAAAWEIHLRPHRSVSEVVVTPELSAVGDVDACLLLDETEQQLDHLLKAIKTGYHTFLISRLPLHTPSVEKVYHAAEEANILLQFSHWPSIAPASRWMMKQIEKPDFIQVIRETDPSHVPDGDPVDELEYLWIDELAFCLKSIRGTVHHFDINDVKPGSGRPCAIQLSLRFDSGATANIFIHTGSSRQRHTRFVAGSSLVADCNALTQEVRMGREGDGGHIFYEKRSFDATEAAGQAVMHFLKSIQLRKPTAYNGYDLMKLSRLADRIRSRLERG